MYKHLSVKELEWIEAQLRSIARDLRASEIPSFSSKYSKKSYSQRQLQTLLEFRALSQYVLEVRRLFQLEGKSEHWRRIADATGMKFVERGPLSYRGITELLKHRQLRLALGLRRIPHVSTLIKYAKRAGQHE